MNTKTVLSQEAEYQFLKDNFVRINSLENLATYLSKDKSFIMPVEEIEYTLKKLYCDYDNYSLQFDNTLKTIQNVRNTLVKYYSICISKERENKEVVDWEAVEKYTLAISKTTSALDYMLFNKRRPY